MSSWGAVLDRVTRENILFSVLVELTYRCNLDCFFCYNDLTLKDRLELLDVVNHPCGRVRVPFTLPTTVTNRPTL